MSALTSSGLWPVTVTPVTDWSVLQTIVPRVALQPPIWGATSSTSSSGSGSTGYPLVPAFTKYPVTP